MACALRLNFDITAVVPLVNFRSQTSDVIIRLESELRQARATRYPSVC